jgi:hypothetical protein
MKETTISARHAEGINGSSRFTAGVIGAAGLGPTRLCPTLVCLSCMRWTQNRPDNLGSLNISSLTERIFVSVRGAVSSRAGMAIGQSHLACFPRFIASDAILVGGAGPGRSGRGGAEAPGDRLRDRPRRNRGIISGPKPVLSSQSPKNRTRIAVRPAARDHKGTVRTTYC